MSAQTAKREAESLFKAPPKVENTQTGRIHPVLKDISDAELERRLDEIRQEKRRRLEEKREEMIEGARHEWEKDRETFVNLAKKINERGGFRDAFLQVATTSHGAFAPHLVMERDLPVAYIPDEIRPEGATTMKRSRTGTAGARSALSEKAPERGAGGETQDEIIVRVVNEKKGEPMTLEDVIAAISIDEIFGAYLKREPRGLSRKIGGVAKRGLIKKTSDGKYVPA